MNTGDGGFGDNISWRSSMSRDQGDPDYAGYAVGTFVRTQPSPRCSVTGGAVGFSEVFAGARNEPRGPAECVWAVVACHRSAQAGNAARCVAGRGQGVRAALGRTAANERQGPHLRSDRELLRVCGEEVAALCGQAEVAAHATHM